MSIIQKSHKCLEYNTVIAELANFAKLEQSRKLCYDLTPFVKPIDIEQQLKYTREARLVLDTALDIPIDKIVNFTKLKEKNEYFIEEELVDIAKSLRTYRLVRNFLKENLPQEANLNYLVENIFTNKELEDKIFNIFDDNLVVKATANTELKGLYSSLKDTEALLKEKVRDLINSPDFQSNLQELWWRW
jgi:DNA mismatch repair protein MutS2